MVDVGMLKWWPPSHLSLVFHKRLSTPCIHCAIIKSPQIIRRSVEIPLCVVMSQLQDSQWEIDSCLTLPSTSVAEIDFPWCSSGQQQLALIYVNCSKRIDTLDIARQNIIISLHFVVSSLLVDQLLHSYLFKDHYCIITEMSRVFLQCTLRV